MSKLGRAIKKLPVVLMLLLITGCSAAEKQIKHGKLSVETKMSESIFLDPVSGGKKTVLVQSRNTSGNANLGIKGELIAMLEGKGYQVVREKSAAHFILQANVLQVGKVSEDEEWRELMGGYGGTLGGALIGASIMGSRSNASDHDYLVGGSIGAGVGFLADSMVEVVRYRLVTDLQVSERSGSGWKEHKTRVVSVAKKTNLKLDRAIPELKSGIAASVAGLFD